MATAERDLSWQRDGPSWPLHETSSFVASSGMTWHIQQYGRGPVALLVHGTGASTHTWAGFGPLLAKHYSVIAVDLPGHAFTDPAPPHWVSLDSYAKLISGLMDTLNVRLALAVGHSAGAAILIRMAIDNLIRTDRIIGLNAALNPFPGASGQLFPVLAKLMFTNPIVPRLFAWRARNQIVVDNLLSATGSRVPDESANIYGRLFQSPRHVQATLKMMANWDLERLQLYLPRLATPTTLLAGARDRMVAPRQSCTVCRATNAVEAAIIPDVGHLMHEEAPGLIAKTALDSATRK